MGVGVLVGRVVFIVVVLGPKCVLIRRRYGLLRRLLRRLCSPLGLLGGLGLRVTCRHGRCRCRHDSRVCRVVFNAPSLSRLSDVFVVEGHAVRQMEWGLDGLLQSLA